MTNDPETNFSDDDAFQARLRAMAPAPTTASLERVLERLESPNVNAPSPPRVALRLPAWAVFGSGAGVGALAASIAWIALTSWNAPSTRGPEIASRPAGLPTPTAWVSPPEMISEQELENAKAKSKDIASRPAYPIANDEFGVDMIRNTLSAVSKQQWDRRRLEERGYSISARSNRSADANASPSRRIPSRANGSLWDLRRGNLDGIDL
ncbi:MAG: hypothetical protein ACK5OB_08865 [Pirellula sp.]